jgi:hypothetical protein
MNSSNYELLEKRLEILLVETEQLYNFCESVLSTENIPLVDRFYFYHSFEIANLIWHTIQDRLETIENLKTRDIEERKKYLLTN